MKAIKFIFAFSLFFMALTSCTSDSLEADEALYSQDDLIATGEDGTAEVDRTRD